MLSSATFAVQLPLLLQGWGWRVQAVAPGKEGEQKYFYFMYYIPGKEVKPEEN